MDFKPKRVCQDNALELTATDQTGSLSTAKDVEPHLVLPAYRAWYWRTDGGIGARTREGCGCLWPVGLASRLVVYGVVALGQIANRDGPGFVSGNTSRRRHTTQSMNPDRGQKYLICPSHAARQRRSGCSLVSCPPDGAGDFKKSKSAG